MRYIRPSIDLYDTLIARRPGCGFDAPAGQGDELARTLPSSNAKAIIVSTPPSSSVRKTSRAPGKTAIVQPAADDNTPAPRDGNRPALAERLPGMSDYQLTAYQSSTARIGSDPQHPKYASARRDIPLIEAEIRRRADAHVARKPDAPA
jgi:hypothetical protein